MNESLKKKTVKGAIWVTCEKLSVQIVGFAVSMVLARLLTPHDYGTVALLSIFFSVASTLTDCGLGKALVQKKEVAELEFNSVFYLSLAMSAGMYLIFFFLAPYIADFYRMPVLCPVTRVSALQFIFSAVNSVQVAELNRKMLFYLRFRVSLIVCVSSAVVGIVLAIYGFGVWALVWSTIFSGIVGVFAWWMIIAWRPKLMFSLAAVKGLFSFGWKMTVSGLVHTAYSNLYGFLIGRIYTPADLAYVNKGNSVPCMLMSTIEGAIAGVSFPALAKMQDNLEAFRRATRHMIRTSTFLVFPLLGGLAACAKPLILLLYGDQWDPAVPYVMIACFSFALYPMNSVNTSAIAALGRSDIYLLLDCIKKAFGILLIFLTIRHGVIVLMCALAFAMSPFAVIVNATANGRLLRYSLRMQLADVLPAALVTLPMMMLVYVESELLARIFVEAPHVVTRVLSLGVGIPTGCLAYLLLSRAFRLRAMSEFGTAFCPLLDKKLPAVANYARWIFHVNIGE